MKREADEEGNTCAEETECSASPLKLLKRCPTPPPPLTTCSCPQFLYFIIHKPRDVLSDRVDSQLTQKVLDPKHPRFGEQVTGRVRRTTVYDVAEKAGFPNNLGLAGRLDYKTSGIMLMSNDSKLLEGVIRPLQDEVEGDKSEEENSSFKAKFKYKTKVYEVRCFSERLFEELTDFAAIEEELSAPFTFSRYGFVHHTSRADVKVLRRWQSEERSHGRRELGWSVDLRIELREGKHHQIRRMCKRSKFIIDTLHRTRIASILSIETIPEAGDCRWLTQEEVRELYEGLGIDRGEDDGKKIQL